MSWPWGMWSRAFRSREAPAWASEVVACDGDADASEAFLGVFEFGARDAEIGDAEFAEEQGGEEVDVVRVGGDVEAPAAVDEAEAETLEVAMLGVDLRRNGRELCREGFEFGGGDVEDGGDDNDVEDDEGGDDEGGGEGGHDVINSALGSSSALAIESDVVSTNTRYQEQVQHKDERCNK